MNPYDHEVRCYNSGAELSGGVVTVAAMPSITHETVVELIRNRPSLVPELLGGMLGMDVPAHEQVRLESADCTAVAPNWITFTATTWFDRPLASCGRCRECPARSFGVAG